MTKIEKEQQKVVVFTNSYRITCMVHTPPGARLSDFIAAVRQKKFIPVSDVIITDVSGNEICRTSFMELNTDEVVFFIPVDEVAET